MLFNGTLINILLTTCLKKTGFCRCFSPMLNGDFEKETVKLLTVPEPKPIIVLNMVKCLWSYLLSRDIPRTVQHSKVH